MKPVVLIVEDEAAIRLALSGLLRREGYEVEQADGGDAAIARLRADTVDLVLTDLALGAGASGMDVLRATRERLPETPVVMITAHGNEKIAVEAMKAGASDYVPKPFDNDEIRLVVRRALDRTRLERENRLLRERIDRSGVALRIDVDEAGMLVGDPEKLRRVVINLVGNALDAMNGASVRRPAIEVQAGENLAGTEVWLRVRDNGPGIERDRIEQIWAPFHTSKANGTGLGLPITRKVVETHGGSIEVEAPPDGGTEFRVVLPKAGLARIGA